MYYKIVKYTCHNCFVLLIIIDKSKVRTPSPPPPTSSSGAASEDDDDDYNDARYRESKIPRMRMYADDETQAITRKRLNSASNSR